MKTRLLFGMLTIGILFVGSLNSTGVHAQSNATLSKQLITLQGSWVQESWMLVFEKNNVAKEFFEGKLTDTYKYKITPAKSLCAKEIGTDESDTTNTFLQFDDIKTGKHSCYQINVISAKILNIQAAGLPKGSEFRRPKNKR